MIRLICLLSMLLMVPGCTSSENIAGGSEAGNSVVAGLVLDSQGRPVTGARVRLYPADFNPIEDDGDSITEILTDRRGAYVASLPSGGYNAVISDARNERLAFVPGIRTNVFARDTVWAEDALLAEPGTIFIPIPEFLRNRAGDVFIQGTPYSVKVIAGVDGVWLNNLPAGRLPAIYFVDTGSETNLIEDSTWTSPGDTSIAASLVVVTSLDSTGNWNPSEIILRDSLRAFGYNVELLSDSGFNLADVRHYDLIVLGVAAGRETVGTQLRLASIPVFNMEYFQQTALGATGPVADVDFGSFKPAQEIEIDGMGVTRIFQAPTQVEWGSPSAEATIIATIPGEPNHAVIYRYETGDAMAEGTAPARRSSFFAYSQSIPLLNAEGWAQVSSGVAWALGIRP